MRRILGLVVGLALFAPSSGRSQGTQDKDPTAKVAGGGVLVAGWKARVDFPNPPRNQKVEDLKLETMGPGMHITSGPHAIYWSPTNVAKGNYTVNATFGKRNAQPAGHEESYGLFIGGSELDSDKQNYLYCVVFGAGDFMVKHRYGSEQHTIQAKTVDEAVSKSAENGAASDEIAMSVTSDKVSCAINGKEVWSMPKKDAIGEGKLVSTDGVYGLRASHNLSIHIANFGMAQK